MNFFRNILKISLRTRTLPAKPVPFRCYCGVSTLIRPIKVLGVPSLFSGRDISSSSFVFSEENQEEEATNGDDKEEGAVKAVDPSKDRSKIIPPEVSIKYLNSKAYATTYGDEPVWVKYRRNFKGQFPPRRTRRKCIKDGMIISGNPCPICRDEYLVVHYTNVKLLKQFICPHTGVVLPVTKTNVCREKHLALEVAILQAKDHGFITWDVPFRVYDYEEYYPQLRK